MVEVEAELLQTLQTNLSSTIVTFYQGELEEPARSNTPALALWIENSSIQALDTAADVAVFTGRIRIFYPLTNYIKDTGVPVMTGTVVLQAPYAIKELVEARDVANGTYATSSIMGILRKRSVLRGTNYTFHNNFSIDYTTFSKPKFPFIQADITFKVTAIPIRRSTA